MTALMRVVYAHLAVRSKSAILIHGWFIFWAMKSGIERAIF
jgi:hypothetical protein